MDQRRTATTAVTKRKGGEMNEALLDVDGAAERLSVSPRFMRKLVAERRIPFFKVGSMIRFDTADLRDWLQTCRVEVPD